MEFIDVSNLGSSNSPIYGRFENLSNKKLDYIENMLTPKGFFDKMSYYSDGRSKILNVIDGIKNQRKITNIMYENPEMAKNTLEKIAKIKSEKN